MNSLHWQFFRLKFEDKNKHLCSKFKLKPCKNSYSVLPYNFAPAHGWNVLVKHCIFLLALQTRELHYWPRLSSSCELRKLSADACVVDPHGGCCWIRFQTWQGCKKAQECVEQSRQPTHLGSRRELIECLRPGVRTPACTFFIRHMHHNVMGKRDKCKQNWMSSYFFFNPPTIFFILNFR